MGVADILVMWPGPFEQTFVSSSLGVSISHLSSIGPVASKKELFENVDGRRKDVRVNVGSGELIRNSLLELFWCFTS